jgi:hypothetical protein
MLIFFFFLRKLVRVDDHMLIASFEKLFSCCGKEAGKLHFYANEKGGSGLSERLIVLTAFGMFRSEKYKRDLALKILQQIAENAGG